MSFTTNAILEFMYNRTFFDSLCTLLGQTVTDDNYDLDVLGFNYAFTKHETTSER